MTDIVKVVRMIGYLLEFSCKHQKTFMHVENGSDGKSVLIDLLAAFVGKNKQAMFHFRGFQKGSAHLTGMERG